MLVCCNDVALIVTNVLRGYSKYLLKSAFYFHQDTTKHYPHKKVDQNTGTLDKNLKIFKNCFVLIVKTQFLAAHPKIFRYLPNYYVAHKADEFLDNLTYEL